MSVYKVSTKDYIDFKKKKIARLAVTRALRQGYLIRSDVCEMCNSQCKTNAHHIDYGKPLSVLWVCIKCHGLCHRSDHNLNPNNNTQTPTSTVWDHSDSITISLSIPIKQFMILKEESKKQNKKISSMLRQNISEKYPLESFQMEFNFEGNVNDKSQNVPNKDIQRMESDKVSVLQSENKQVSIIRTERDKSVSGMERKFFEFPYGLGGNASQLQRIASN